MSEFGELPSIFIHAGMQMQAQGVRRLLILSGDERWSIEQAQMLSTLLPGNWLWVSNDAPANAEVISPDAAHTLLGQEWLHGIFDARQGFNVDALAAFCGTLKAGSWLILLAPSWQTWADRPDVDSLRWSEQSEAIATPQFITRFQNIIENDCDSVVWRQGEKHVISLLPDRSDWIPPDGSPTLEQQQILSRLRQAESGIWVLTAERGRGKSTLAGMLVTDWPGQCWLTAPSKLAAEQVLKQSRDAVHFWSPDALLAHCREGLASGIDWLLVDEAAAIPAPLLLNLIDYFPRILLLTTVQGYEGTGRGFILKFCSSLPQWQDLRLTAPVRWSANDSLEPLLDKLLLLNDKSSERLPIQTSSVIELTAIEASHWLEQPDLLEHFYGLLTSAHYRTTPLDLRRLMDAPNMSFIAAKSEHALLGALWLVDEGGLTSDLAHEIWAGRRRPRGNLVAQSLAAHGGQCQAPLLRSRRISRIAVLPYYRRQGLARSMILSLIGQAERQSLDFLSVSFGYTEVLWQLWQSCGFRFVRIGSQQEASSGCYSAMALFPLSDAGKRLCERAEQRLNRDWRWLSQRIPLELPLSAIDDSSLNDDDWRELSGFAFAHRSLESSLGALQRLLNSSDLPLLALRGHLQQQFTQNECVQRLNLSGSKALLRLWRQETQRAMSRLDTVQCEKWRDWSKPVYGVAQLT